MEERLGYTNDQWRRYSNKMEVKDKIENGNEEKSGQKIKTTKIMKKMNFGK